MVCLVLENEVFRNYLEWYGFVEVLVVRVIFNVWGICGICGVWCYCFDDVVDFVLSLWFVVCKFD